MMINMQSIARSVATGAVAGSLEGRRMLAVTASLGAGTLCVYGDDAGNGIALDSTSTHILLKVYSAAERKYVEVQPFQQSDAKAVRIYGRGGDDTITVGTGVEQPAVIAGGRGADWIKAGGGDTVLYGNEIDQNA